MDFAHDDEDEELALKLGTLPVALTIAGSDSGGGAGIQADLKAIQANGVFAATAITAVTAQNTREVRTAYDLPTEVVAAQIDAVASDLPVKAVKTGMLSSAAIIEVVAERIAAHQLGPLVVDPVMISKSGHALLADEAIETLVGRLLPLAALVTPNADEAARLTGLEVRTLDQARQAAEAIIEMGAAAVLVKGGHLDARAQAVDVLLERGGHEVLCHTARFDTPHTHGTGCTYAAAIAANLAKGFNLGYAVRRAKRYVAEAIRHGLAIGGGHGPTHHFWFLRGSGLFPADDE